MLHRQLRAVSNPSVALINSHEDPLSNRTSIECCKLVGGVCYRWSINESWQSSNYDQINSIHDSQIRTYSTPVASSTSFQSIIPKVTHIYYVYTYVNEYILYMYVYMYKFIYSLFVYSQSLMSKVVLVQFSRRPALLTRDNLQILVSLFRE